MREERLIGLKETFRERMYWLVRIALKIFSRWFELILFQLMSSSFKHDGLFSNTLTNSSMHLASKLSFEREILCNLKSDW